MDKDVVKSEHLLWAEQAYPQGKIAERRRIIRCSIPFSWYRDNIGKVIKVHYFSTFGCWDTKGRWIDYYDMSLPVGIIPSLKRFYWRIWRLRRFIKRLFYAESVKY